MLNILVALRLWQSSWQNKKIEIACDNKAAVIVLNTGKTRELLPETRVIARNIQLTAALHNIELKIVHVPGKMNKVADLLS